MEPVTFITEDKIEIKGELIHHDDPSGVTIIHGATGVPMGYYRPFAKWLSGERNHHVLIYRYRDSELKTASELKKAKTSMSDWGMSDQSAALDFAITQFPQLTVHTIGHSLGGMCLPYHRNAEKVKSHVAVNAGPAYWKSHPWHYVPQVILFWHVLGPFVTKLFGYMPGKLIGLNVDLPSRVYWQWRRWCNNPRFYEIDWGKTIDRPDLSRVKCDVHLVSTKDDVMIPPWQVAKLARYFPAASVEHTTIEPKNLGLKSIGHIGIFAKRSAAAWPYITRQLAKV